MSYLSNHMIPQHFSDRLDSPSPSKSWQRSYWWRNSWTQPHKHLESNKKWWLTRNFSCNHKEAEQITNGNPNHCQSWILMCLFLLVIGLYLHSYPQSWLAAWAGFCPWLPWCNWGTCEQKHWSLWPPDDSTLSTGTDRRSSCRNGLRICRRRRGTCKKRAQ